MHLKHVHNCRLCGNPNLSLVVDLGNMSSQGFFKYKDKPAPPTRKIPTRIVRCDTQKWEKGCGLVQNQVIVPPEILYSNYGYASSISKTMTDHLKSLNSKIKEIKGDLNGKVVVDIGCNDGTFLSFYGPEVRKVGIDPSDIARSVRLENTTILNTCFPDSKLFEFSSTTDVITAFACMYDIENITRALQLVETMLIKDGIFVFEVAYLPTVLDNLCYDGLVHEHISLFSLATLEYALDKVALKVFKAEKTETNGGSLLVFACKNLSERKIETEQLRELRLEEFNAELDEPKTYELFRERVNQHARDLKTRLVNFKNEGKKIHILGASTKLNTILGAWNIGSELIDCAAERDPRKWGGQLTNGIPIVSEEESRKSVDVYLVGPYHFKPEILLREKEMIDKGLEMLFPLPNITVVNKNNYNEHLIS